MTVQERIDLIDAYRKAKSAIKEGRRTPQSMTDEEQAGLMLVLGGLAALHNLDALPLSVRQVYEKKWPRVRSLLTQALKA